MTKIILTAAMEGTPDCPGEPWDTSIPKIIVGTLDIRGIAGDDSTWSIEFKPPSCLKSVSISTLMVQVQM